MDKAREAETNLDWKLLAGAIRRAMLHKNTKLVTTLIPTFYHVGAELFAYGFCIDQRKYPSTLTQKIGQKKVSLDLN